MKNPPEIFKKLYSVGGHTKSLDQLIQHAADFAQEYFRLYSEFPYVWYVQNDLGTFPVIAMDVPPGSKDDVAEDIRQMLSEVNADSFVFMAEAWVVEVDKNAVNKDGTIDMALMPSNHPDRVEILTITGEDGERIIGGQFKIIRQNGKRPTLSKFEIKYSETMTGRFVGLLPHKGTKH